MKGYVPVLIPTKKYIKAYIIHKIGNNPIMTTRNCSIGSKLYDLLEHSTNADASDYGNKFFNENIKVYIPVRTFKQRGANLNETNVRNFNLFIENELKDKFHYDMDQLIELLPNFMANLPQVRRKLGIDIESWSDDSMKKDYYRYRLRSGKSLFYTKYFSKTFNGTVPQQNLPAKQV